MMSPTHIREIYAEELRRLGEPQRAERVLQGVDASAVTIAAVRAMIRIANECDTQRVA